MKQLLLVIFFVPVLASAQRTITIDLDKSDLTQTTRAGNTDIVLKFSNCDAGGQINATIKKTGAGPKQKVINCSEGIKLSLSEVLSTTMSLKAGAKFLAISFDTKGAATLVKDQGGNGAAAKPVSFYDESTLKPEHFDDKDKKYRMVEYFPCRPGYETKNHGNARRGFWYNLFGNDKGDGAVFVINNFNVLKYDISVGNTFENRFTEVPALFNTVGGLISDGVKAESGVTIVEDIQAIMVLNRQLKKIMTEDCLDFEEAKKQFKTNVEATFVENGKFCGIDCFYNEKVGAEITSAGTREKFNENMKAQLHLTITPDSLVTETIAMYELLMSTKFQYHSNIIQLENADEVVYTLNIKGKTGVKNANINVTNQPIRVPIFGGVKIDFSTGFYYSTIKNEKYALRSIAINDSTNKKEIVNEGNFSGGTAGINALMHIYPRLSKHFNASLTFGVGKALDLNYSILFGGSLLFGRDNRFALSGGWNLSNIKVLSQANLDSTGSRVQLANDATDVKYDNKFKRGAFVSFTYSLSGKKAQPAAEKEEK
ncbi:MAG: hypothetical protein P0Y49_05085 [Candidatus Pedobacter colombiensis]|uniref:Outer membrane protein beta-barrel domain-containing protein n=1 Tax=Candidatus Pedobacter colombiensis TaxID=3121371 RepID=A0AAJ5WA11_9SPHI|nr:hypothetical protein [Pedobacter sp.]WEK20510.1 MAG: hypothetical protein P0Y49_05085 [Pedobacter sp.]